jgi:hypothetical protein
MESLLSSTPQQRWRILHFPQVPPVSFVNYFVLRWEDFYRTHIFTQVLVLEPLQRVPPTAHRAAVFPRDNHATP